uniref:Uncharacterized protein n=1 Tax=Chromera velia CCMP2878 TaxID=1169474 RepID=A0A0G4HSP4_9ALVE|eukprot:Cvel_8328.t1-p1 / transcript=Cvel_8328.t1 / gene=Cvel_8328 / organism=Chromera_velia_CCMP2878 / gene_product=hypothetical protein / transcript_product=hypothetical protein / location=Cvel_scaffold458:16471-20176(+) / protein_length=917 / sequence_SO=supercontig / SO=protein_coding / is_pseudo=false
MQNACRRKFSTYFGSSSLKETPGLWVSCARKPGSAYWSCRRLFLDLLLSEGTVPQELADFFWQFLSERDACLFKTTFRRAKERVQQLALDFRALSALSGPLRVKKVRKVNLPTERRDLVTYDTDGPWKISGGSMPPCIQPRAGALISFDLGARGFHRGLLNFPLAIDSKEPVHSDSKQEQGTNAVSPLHKAAEESRALICGGTLDEGGHSGGCCEVWSAAFGTSPHLNQQPPPPNPAAAAAAAAGPSPCLETCSAVWRLPGKVSKRIETPFRSPDPMPQIILNHSSVCVPLPLDQSGQRLIVFGQFCDLWDSDKFHTISVLDSPTESPHEPAFDSQTEFPHPNWKMSRAQGVVPSKRHSYASTFCESLEILGESVSVVAIMGGWLGRVRRVRSVVSNEVFFLQIPQKGFSEKFVWFRIPADGEEGEEKEEDSQEVGRADSGGRADGREDGRERTEKGKGQQKGQESGKTKKEKEDAETRQSAPPQTTKPLSASKVGPPSLTMPQGRVDHSFTSVGSRFFLYGGVLPKSTESLHRVLDDLWIFSRDADAVVRTEKEEVKEIKVGQIPRSSDDVCTCPLYDVWSSRESKERRHVADYLSQRVVVNLKRLRKQKKSSGTALAAAASTDSVQSAFSAVHSQNLSASSSSQAQAAPSPASAPPLTEALSKGVMTRSSFQKDSSQILFTLPSIHEDREPRTEREKEKREGWKFAVSAAAAESSTSTRGLWRHAENQTRGKKAGVCVRCRQKSVARGWRWKRVSQQGCLPGPRCLHSCATVGPRLFIFGGSRVVDYSTITPSPLSDLFCLDTQTLLWSQIEIDIGCFSIHPPPSISSATEHDLSRLICPRFGASLCHDGRDGLWIFGGRRGPDKSTQVNDFFHLQLGLVEEEKSECLSVSRSLSAWQASKHVPECECVEKRGLA